MHSACGSQVTETLTTSAKLHAIGQYVQLGGVGAFVVGAVLSLHHYAIGVCFIAGAAAFYVGMKMRAS